MEVDISDESEKAPDVSMTSECTLASDLNHDESLPPPLLPTPQLTQSGRPRRQYQLPKRFHDNLPEPEAPLPAETEPAGSGTAARITRVILIVRNRLVTALNSFGLWRDYPERPSFDPDSNLTLDKSLSKDMLHSQFQESTVEILVPSGDVNIPPRLFPVSGLLHRNLTSAIRDAFTGPLSHLLHFSPYKLFHKSPITREAERVYGEIYTSDAFLNETEQVRRHGQLPPEDPGCVREKVVAAVMFASDATQLTQFGDTKAWPIYFMLGNLSKYVRAKPDSGRLFHLAYIPVVSI
jgi:hypothetical protein